MHRVVSIWRVLFFVFLAATASAQKKNDASTLFTVAKKPVTIDEFSYLYSKNNQGKKEEFTQAKIEEYLNLFINFKLKVEEARHRGYDTTAAFKKEFNSYRAELRKPYMPDDKLIDSLTELTYNRMKEEVKASHILINLQPDAAPADTLKAFEKISSIRKRVIDGYDFQAAALEFSEDPTAKMNKGSLGWFTALQMVFPFEQAAFTTPVGEVSKPVRTRFGYHIVKVFERRPARGEIEVSHIMLRGTGEEDDNHAKDLAFEVYDKLQKGVSWNELCAEYSEDPSSKENGGKLRPFGVGVMSAVPEFEQAAFELKQPGDFSDPVKTQFGWHIIKLERKIPLPSFNELAPSIKNRVSRDERAQISRQAIQNKMKREFGFTENSEVKAKVFALADSSMTKGRWKANGRGSDEILFVMNGTNYPVKSFLEYLEKNQKANLVGPAKYMEQMYNQYVDEVQGEVFEERIKQKNPEYGFLLNEYYEGILLFEIMEREVWNRASQDSIGQHQYYLAHKGDYKASDRVKATIFSSPSKESVSQLQGMMGNADSTAIQTFVTKEKIRREAGNFEKSDRPVLSKIGWTTGTHALEHNNMHYLVVVKTLLPPGNKSFEEARSSVISDYQNFLEKEWLSKLRKKYPVKVNKKGKQK
ncbi:MAG TPA: peptidylprolyl isomerase, partial [Chryseosolibacter sp.]